MLVCRGAGDEPHTAVCVTRGVCVWGGGCALLAGPADQSGLWGLCVRERKAAEVSAQPWLLQWVAVVKSTADAYTHTLLWSLRNLFCHCLVHCGWSSWSEWGECLGPCGVQSVQWSFRSPNNPPKHGDGRTCRGIYRKARRWVSSCFHWLETVYFFKAFSTLTFSKHGHSPWDCNRLTCASVRIYHSSTWAQQMCYQAL